MKEDKKIPNVPWITKKGFLDPTKLPIEILLTQTLSNDIELFRSGCKVLQIMHQAGRKEAGIYLMGLLRYYQNDLEKLVMIVESLRGFNIRECADTLFAELKRVKSSNTTRKYVNAIIRELSYFPYEIVKEGLQELSQDKSFSYKMRNKFQELLDSIQYRSFDY